MARDKSFWSTPCSRRAILHNLQNSKNLTSSPQKFRPDTVESARNKNSQMSRESLNTTVPSPKWTWYVESPCWNLFPTRYDGLTENSFYGIQSWRIFLTLWNFKPGKSTQKLRCVSTNTRSSGHHALDQRSCKYARNICRTCHIAIDRGAKFSWFRCAWCDCDCIKTTSQHAINLSKKSKCRRTTSPAWIPTDSYEERQISHMIYEYFRATGAQESMQGLTDLVFLKFTERRWSRFRRWDLAQ